MKRTFIVIALLNFMISVYAQDSTIVRISGSHIILIGANHEDDHTLFRKNEKESLGEIFPDLKKLAGKRPMIILTEGMNTDGKMHQLMYSDSNWRNMFPSAFDSVMIMGGDIRDHKKYSAVRKILYDNFFYLYYPDTCSHGKSFETCFFSQCRFPYEKLRPSAQDSFVRNAITFSEINLSFENTLIRDAEALELQGYYVIVSCGTTHAIRIRQRYSWDHVIYITDLWANMYSVHTAAVADLFGH